VDLQGFQQSKKLVPWTAEHGKNLETFSQMWNEYKNLEIEWNFGGNHAGSGPTKFQVFRQCVDKRARNMWDAISRTPPVNQTSANFYNKINELIRGCGTNNPRDKVTEYLENAQCVRKRRDTDVFTHGARLELLFFYHDMLPGNTLELIGDDPKRVLKRKKILFRSFPEEWQENCIRNHDNPNNATDTWQFILQKMELEKNAWDRRTTPANSIRRGGPGRGLGGRTQASLGGRGHSRPSQYY